TCHPIIVADSGFKTPFFRKRQLNPIFPHHSNYVMISFQQNHNHKRNDHGRQKEQEGDIKN
ncbi:MAG: hypothetical protein KAI39_06440, partial [Desulfobulbaceae bacterium]|nr:hypothetical protein [Desulfobulbaceae bacterium]